MSRNQKDWDDCLLYLLFAYREVPQESTGFSPFEKLYGRKVRGPLDVLREKWVGYTAEEEETPIATYVVEMRDRLEEMSGLVQEGMVRAQQRQKALYDKGAKEWGFEIGDKVLVLLPMQHNRLKLEWVGPYTVVRKVTPRGHGTKVYHVNLMKKWHSAQSESRGVCLALCPNTVDDDAEEETPVLDLCGEGDLYPEVFENVTVNMEAVAPDLSEGQRQQLRYLIEETPSVFQSKPGRTTIVQHSIHVGDAAPIRQRLYRIPYSRREMMKRELDEMLASGVIRPSTSLWASPIVLVEKKNGGVRFCMDFRKLNQVARFDAYPMPLVEEVFESIGTSAVVTTLDLASGYGRSLWIPSPVIRPPSPHHLACSNLKSYPWVFTVLQRHSRE